MLYQEFLMNAFLLDRLPECWSLKTRQNLVDVARKMLDGILILCANKDKLVKYNLGIVWAVGDP